MARNYLLGGVRRGQLLRNYGPGSIIDFRPEKSGPVSIVATSIDYWHKYSRASKNQIIYDRRLQKVVKKDHFRLPPVVADRQKFESEENDFNRLMGFRFPKNLYCPECSLLQDYRKFSDDAGDPGKYCAKCSAKKGKKIYTIPFRFIASCEKGHLSDFPLMSWFKRIIHHKDINALRNSLHKNKSIDPKLKEKIINKFKAENCTDEEKIKMLLLQSGSLGLAGLKLTCNNCYANLSMEGIFEKEALKGFSCNGYAQWLGKREDCNLTPRILQRGASNIYFPFIISALAIPPWFDRLDNCLGTDFGTIVEDYKEEISLKSLRWIKNTVEKAGFTYDENLIEQIKKRVEYHEDEKRENLKADEYKEFLEIHQDNFEYHENYEFQIRSKPVDSLIKKYIEKIVQVVRLREVQVLTGFKRIKPASSQTDTNMCSIGGEELDWLPASEVRGEGIFVKLNEESLKNWEKKDIIKTRSFKIREVYENHFASENGDSQPLSLKITPRFLLIHSLAHIMIRQLSIECGYSSSSLKERIYVDDGEESMCGFLIYTATSDSDGTLGGLSRQAEPDLFTKTLVKGLESSVWCSADPLCITTEEKINDDYNLAACHSCLLMPETACDHSNSYLDRALIVGLNYEKNDIPGFFQDLIEEKEL